MCIRDSIRPNRLLSWSTRLASTGYALPGAVLAIGVMIPLTRFDNALDAFMRNNFDYSTGLLLSGTITAIVFAYVVRFIAVAYGSIDSSLGKITPSRIWLPDLLAIHPLKCCGGFTYR